MTDSCAVSSNLLAASNTSGASFEISTTKNSIIAVAFADFDDSFLEAFLALKLSELMSFLSLQERIISKEVCLDKLGLG